MSTAEANRLFKETAKTHAADADVRTHNSMWCKAIWRASQERKDKYGVCRKLYILDLQRSQNGREASWSDLTEIRNRQVCMRPCA